MKTNIFKKLCAVCVLGGLMASCSDVLDEQPRSNFDPSFFNTETGIEGGLTSLYAHLRYFYGNGYYLNSCETGTDEYTWAQSADGNFKDADLSGVGSMTSTSCRADILWGTAFANINTASGVIENGEASGINASLLAEAYFFRAFDYFLLVQTFGGVPLDLGAGERKWTWSQNDNQAKIEDHSAAMTAATPATITIDYILDERMREFWGEGYRWFDLVRTQTWAEKAGVFHIAGTQHTDRTLEEFHRDIPVGYYLRPIPQGQLDGLEMTDEEKVLYQNPAYRN